MKERKVLGLQTTDVGLPLDEALRASSFEVVYADGTWTIMYTRALIGY
jgi:hypothetical protein